MLLTTATGTASSLFSKASGPSRTVTVSLGTAQRGNIEGAPRRIDCGGAEALEVPSQKTIVQWFRLASRIRWHSSVRSSSASTTSPSNGWVAPR
jgi:hypothetical protein